MLLAGLEDGSRINKGNEETAHIDGGILPDWSPSTPSICLIVHMATKGATAGAGVATMQMMGFLDGERPSGRGWIFQTGSELRLRQSLTPAVLYSSASNETSVGGEPEDPKSVLGDAVRRVGR